MNRTQRTISKETFDHLDSLEKVVVQKWVVQGIWKIIDDGEN